MVAVVATAMAAVMPAIFATGAIGAIPVSITVVLAVHAARTYDNGLRRGRNSEANRRKRGDGQCNLLHVNSQIEIFSDAHLNAGLFDMFRRFEPLGHNCDKHIWNIIEGRSAMYLLRRIHLPERRY